jgi:nicotinamide riboside transporter PnuC
MEVFGWILICAALYGMYLNSTKRIISSYKIWLVANIGFVIFNIYHDIWLQAVLFFVYTILVIHGLINWKREEEK